MPDIQQIKITSDNGVTKGELHLKHLNFRKIMRLVFGELEVPTQFPHQEGDELYNGLCKQTRVGRLAGESTQGVLRTLSTSSLGHEVNIFTNRGKLHQAPLLPDLKFAVDLGCGAGLYSIELAKKYPSCEVLGIDLNPGKSPSDLPNCKFAIGDINDNWEWFPEQEVDFIVIRGLFGFIDSWHDLLRKAFSRLAPGGWVEVFDIGYMTTSDDGSFSKAKGLIRFDNLFREVLEQLKQDLELLPVLHHVMSDVGFQNSSVTNRKLPFSDFSDEPEMKEILHSSSKLHEMDTTIIAERALQPMLHLSAEEVQAVIADAFVDMRDTTIHAYRNGYVFCAQKPLE